MSRIERGHLEPIRVGTLLRVTAALEIRLDLLPRWRGGELDRTLNAGHAAMHEAVGRLFAGLPWLVAAEVSFSIFGERGVIDVLAFHPASRSLLVIELKTALVDVQATLGSVDRYRRLAPRIARERGWTAATVSTWLVLLDGRTNRRHVAAHSTVLRGAFPHDGRTMRAWLNRPSAPVACLSFLPDSLRATVRTHARGSQRVRVPSAERGARS